jgi:hypothetical protein
VLCWGFDNSRSVAVIFSAGLSYSDTADGETVRPGSTARGLRDVEKWVWGLSRARSRRLIGRLCVLLGALAGPGPGVARALAAAGCRVIAADSDMERLQELSTLINAEIPNSISCCYIPHLDAPYRDSELKSCGEFAELLVDNREWTYYIEHSKRTTNEFATQASLEKDEPSIHLLSTLGMKNGLHALQALDFVTIMRRPDLIYCSLAACRLARGKMRWYKLQQRSSKLLSDLKSGFIYIQRLGALRVPRLIVDLARGSAVPKWMLGIHIEEMLRDT